MKTFASISFALVSLCPLAVGPMHGQEKVPLEAAPAAGSETPDIAKQLASMPDGVLKFKTNEDGSFRSLVVKSTVEIEDSLGAEKGKRIAHKEAEMECKKALSQWLEESCYFVENTDKTLTILTKGDSAKDAAGNKVVTRSQTGTENKVSVESNTSYSHAVLKGMTVLSSEVTEDKEPQYVLIMGLSQKDMNLAKSTAAALQKSGESAPAAGHAKETDRTGVPAPEKKVNPAAADYM